MEKFVEVYDNILSPNLVNYIENFITSPPKDFQYGYLHNVANNNDPQFHPGLVHSLSHNSQPLSNYNSFFNQILYSFCFSQNIVIKNIYKTRSFLQFPLPSSFSKKEIIHTDIDIPHMVCLYYVNDSDGDTVLYEDDEKTEIKRVSPKKGRIVFFDGSIKHCGSYPTKTYRSIVNFDFLGEKL